MSKKTNILIIMSDQHSRHTLGCYGNNIVRTPNLDSLAQSGITFNNAYCPSPVCCPSRMSFMTGRTPTNNKVWNNAQILDSSVPTWAHLLGISGYETSLIGRMHFEGHDQFHGFENRPIADLFTCHPGNYSPANYPSGQNKKVVELSGFGRTNYQWLDEQVTESACVYIKKHAKEDGRPFAAVIGYTLPHCPYIAPKELFDYYMDKVDIPEDYTETTEMLNWYKKSRDIETPFTKERIRIARAAYFAMCEHLDILIGKVLDTLKQTSLDKNTLVIYCSDHGEMAGEHATWTKNTYYEGSVGVPIIARMPGLIPQGIKSDAVCSIMDIAPTLAEIAGCEHITEFDGESLLELFKGNSENWENETFSEVVDDMTSPRIPSRMIRSGDWKLWVDFPDVEKPANIALFNLKNDPNERYNLADNLPYLDIKKDLLAKVFNNWNPKDIVKEEKLKTKNYSFLVNWGSKVKPKIEGCLTPPLGLEDNIKIIEHL